MANNLAPKIPFPNRPTKPWSTKAIVAHTEIKLYSSKFRDADMDSYKFHPYKLLLALLLLVNTKSSPDQNPNSHKSGFIKKAAEHAEHKKNSPSQDSSNKDNKTFVTLHKGYEHHQRHAQHQRHRARVHREAARAKFIRHSAERTIGTLFIAERTIGEKSAFERRHEKARQLAHDQAMNRVKNKPHQRQAILDFIEIEKILKEHNPGSLDKSSDVFRSWLVQGKKEFVQRLDKITSADDALHSLKAYVAGFHDSHLTLNGSEKHFTKQEWPQFLTDFNGKRFVAAASTTPRVPNGSTITKIDDTPTQEWVDANILPYRPAGPKSTASYHEAAPFVFTWRHNPFVLKPTTICIVQKESNEEIQLTLDWKHLSHNELEKQSALIQKQGPSFKETFDPITVTDISKDITWVKIPTFWPPTALGKKMFGRSIKKLSRKLFKRALVFDLRDNGGGHLQLPGQTLQYLYGGKKTAKAIKACWNSVGCNPTTLMARVAVRDDSIMADNITEALAEDTNLIVEQPYWHFNFEAQLKEPAPTAPVMPEIYVIINSGVNSASLMFIDILKKLTHNKVTLIGQPTGADTNYGGVLNFRVNGMTLTSPTCVLRGRSRESNKPYLPDFRLSSIHMKDDTWLKKRTLEVINSNPQELKAFASQQVPIDSPSETPMLQ